MAERFTFSVDVTYTDSWGQVDSKDILKLFVDKSGNIKNIAIKKVKKQKPEEEE